MKQALHCVLLLVLPLMASAQIQKKQIIWTANLNSQFTQYAQTNARTPVYDVGLRGEASFFIRDQVALGVNLQGSWAGNQILVDDTKGFMYYNRSRSVSLMPFIRKYWDIGSFLVYVGGGINLSSSKNSFLSQISYVVSRQDSSVVHQITPQAQLGVIYPVANWLGLNVSAQSALYPISFNSLQLGLVVFTGAKSGVSLAGSLESQYPLAKGRWLISGTFSSTLHKGYSYNSATASDYREPATSIDLGSGFFVRDRLLLGMSIYAGLQEAVLTTSQAPGYIRQNNQKPLLIGIRPYVKKYLSPNRLTPYVQGYVSYNRIMAGGPATNTFYGGLDMGLAYLIGRNWLVEGKLVGVSVVYSKLPSLETDSAITDGQKKFSATIDAGFQPMFTVVYVFR